MLLLEKASLLFIRGIAAECAIKTNSVRLTFGILYKTAYFRLTLGIHVYYQSICYFNIKFRILSISFLHICNKKERQLKNASSTKSKI